MLPADHRRGAGDTGPCTPKGGAAAPRGRCVVWAPFKAHKPPGYRDETLPALSLAGVLTAGSPVALAQGFCFYATDPTGASVRHRATHAFRSEVQNGAQTCHFYRKRAPCKIRKLSSRVKKSEIQATVGPELKGGRSQLEFSARGQEHGMDAGELVRGDRHGLPPSSPCTVPEGTWVLLSLLHRHVFTFHVFINQHRGPNHYRVRWRHCPAGLLRRDSDSVEVWVGCPV